MSSFFERPKSEGNAGAREGTETSPRRGGPRSLWSGIVGDVDSSSGIHAFSTPDVQGQTTDIRSGTLTIIAVLALTAMTLSILFPLVPWSVKLLFMAVVFLSLRYWGGILVLALVQFDLMSREGRMMNVMSGADGFLFAFCIGSVLMFVARQRDVLNEVSRSDFRTLLRRMFADDSRTTTPSGPERDQEAKSIDTTMRLLGSAVRGLLVILLCATIARYSLAVVPRGRAFSLQIRDFIVDNPELTGVSLLVVGVMATVLVLTEIGWRQMTASQGRVYLRSALLKQMYVDLRMVTMRRLRLRQKRHGPAGGENNTSGSTK
ncbi:MAG: hypothetical protein JNM43_23885 [Planctomycetaceae bacterium]|nr:hypothetical protein [Planctomycetaceae bacterium]